MDAPDARDEVDDELDRGGRDERIHIPWPRRALAGVAAAALGAWLAHHAPGASLLPPALTACLAGLLIAALPRVGWLALTAFLATGLVTSSDAGGAVLLVAGALVPVVLMPFDGPLWPLSAAAPALGALGLAGAWPAFAGFAGSAWRRAALAVTGWLWLAIAQGPWVESPSGTVHHVLAPLLTVGTLAGGLVWAAAAIVLPWVRSRRSPIREVVLLGGWAAALAVATIAVSTPGGGGPPRDRGRGRSRRLRRRARCACHQANLAPR